MELTEDSPSSSRMDVLPQQDVTEKQNPASEDDSDAQLDDGIPDGGLHAWLVLFGGFFLSMATFGYFVSWATFQDYYETVLLANDTPSQIAWIGSLQYSLIFFPGLLAGRLFDLGYFKATLITACTAMTIANFLTAECKDYWQFVLCQGALLGFSAGCIYIPCMAVVSHWFRKRRPLAFSIISFGSSVGGIIYPIIFRSLVPSIGFKWTIRTIAFINLVSFIIGCLAMRTRLPPRKKLPRIFDIRAFASRAYLLYVLSTFVAFLGLYTPLVFLGVSAESAGIRPSFALDLVAIVNAASAVGRLGSGFLALSFGAVNTMAIFTTLAAIFTYTWGYVSTEATFTVVTILYGISTGAFICLFPVPVAHLGATDDLGRRSGMQMTVMALGALAGPPISGVIKQNNSTFQGVALYAGTITLASVAVMLVSKYLATKQILTGKF